MMANGQRKRDEVLNLCFHGIGTPGRELEPDEDLYWVSVAQFEEFLEVIGKYPSVRITFDDGNASDVAHALPALRRHNLTAAFFIISGRLDQPGSLATAEVRSLVQAGMTVGSHGMRHIPWRSVDDARAPRRAGGRRGRHRQSDRPASSPGGLPVRLLRPARAQCHPQMRIHPCLHSGRRTRKARRVAPAPLYRTGC